jgi:hypothetical protein
MVIISVSCWILVSILLRRPFRIKYQATNQIFWTIAGVTSIVAIDKTIMYFTL